MFSDLSLSSRKRKNEELHAKRRVPSPPVIGKRPIVPMSVVKGDKAMPVRVVLDSGASTAVISLDFAKRNNLELYRQTDPLAVGDFAGRVVEEAGKFYTYPLLLNYNDHWSYLTFEVALMDRDNEIMMPFWWTTVHVPSNFFSLVQEIEFNSDYCKVNCTKQNCKGFIIEYDLDILFEDNPVNCISFIATDAKGDSYLDWQVVANRNNKLCRVNVSGVVVDVGDLTKLVPKEYHSYMHVFDSKAADRLPERRKWDHTI